eukprot:CAMPEP_0185848648 /NCGR_PEP_ID=MMETSP1354-20130828/3445_1 /TAXON_ID=708628 /ORGANISM="Erythrolobus madagascarensis, Strain CCMP3276" /LENGTH=375 /DNA_ID=CAMNT_0028549063 /DNA_START=60 /DNA_END=1184 /DNA_ORIENTATION=+
MEVSPRVTSDVTDESPPSVQTKDSKKLTANSVSLTLSDAKANEERERHRRSQKMDYFWLAATLRSELKLKSRVIGFKKYNDTILAEDVTKWLVENNLATNKQEARLMGAALIEFGHLYAVIETCGIDMSGIGGSETRWRKVLAVKASTRFGQMKSNHSKNSSSDEYADVGDHNVFECGVHDHVPLRFASDDRDLARSMTVRESESLKFDFETGIAVRNVKMLVSLGKKKTVTGVFSGMDAVEWLLRHKRAQNRSQAVSIAERMMSEGLFHRVGIRQGKSRMVRTNGATERRLEEVFVASKWALYQFGDLDDVVDEDDFDAEKGGWSDTRAFSGKFPMSLSTAFFDGAHDGLARSGTSPPGTKVQSQQPSDASRGK